MDVPSNCLRQLEQDFATELSARWMSAEAYANATAALQAVVGSAIEGCLSCPSYQVPEDVPSNDEAPTPVNESTETSGELSERERIVNEIMADPEAIHGLYGIFDKRHYSPPGWFGIRAECSTTDYSQKIPRPLDSPNGNHSDIADGTRRDYVKGVPSFFAPLHNESAGRAHEKRLGSFVANVSHREISDNGTSTVAFALSYFDTGGWEKRWGGDPAYYYTSYVLALPSRGTARKIQEDPSLMTDLMRTVFPEADRSTNDFLHIDPEQI